MTSSPNKFKPDDDDIFLFGDTKKWQRLIFPEIGPYRDFEEDKYTEFLDYVQENEIEIPDWVTKRMLIRVISGCDFKVDKAAEQLYKHLTWRDETLPIILTDDQRTILDAGLSYTYGRDKSLRPI